MSQIYTAAMKRLVFQRDKEREELQALLRLPDAQVAHMTSYAISVTETARKLASTEAAIEALKREE